MCARPPQSLETQVTRADTPMLAAMRKLGLKGEELHKQIETLFAWMLEQDIPLVAHADRHDTTIIQPVCEGGM